MRRKVRYAIAPNVVTMNEKSSSPPSTKRRTVAVGRSATRRNLGTMCVPNIVSNATTAANANARAIDMELQSAKMDRPLKSLLMLSYLEQAVNAHERQYW